MLGMSGGWRESGFRRWFMLVGIGGLEWLKED